MLSFARRIQKDPYITRLPVMVKANLHVRKVELMMNICL